MKKRYAFAPVALVAPLLWPACGGDSCTPDSAWAQDSGTTTGWAPDGAGLAGEAAPSRPDAGVPAQDVGALDLNLTELPLASCLTGVDELIADFTDDNSLNPADGRRGGFNLYGDSKGSFEPAKVENQAYPIDKTGGSSCSGPGAFHTKATGFRDWGAAIAADLAPKSGDKKGTYDASKYRGISFWARATAPLEGVKVSFPDIYTDGGADPSSLDPELVPCVFESGSVRNCSPYLVKLGDSDFPAYESYRIDTSWRRFDIFFEHTQQDFHNPGFHTAADKLDTGHLTAMAIQVSALYVNDVATANDFEIWIDDVYFIP